MKLPLTRLVALSPVLVNFRWLFVSGLMLLSVFAANAQTDWTTRRQTPNTPLADVAYGAGRYVVIGGEGGGIIRTSSDGISWTTVLADLNSPGLYGIIYAAGKFVTVGLNGTLRTSTDGLTWTSQVSGTDKGLIGIAYGGGQFMAVGYGGTAITSTDGVSWTARTTGTTIDFHDVIYGGGQFVIVGADGIIRTTPNGTIWTARTSGTGKTLASVTVGKSGLFVAVGFSSAIVTSPDGITWTPRSAPGFGDLLGGVACDLVTGQFVAVSNHGNEVLTSPDGITWSLVYSGTQLSLYGVEYVNGSFIALGESGTIRQSSNGVGTAWHPLTITYDLRFSATAFGNGHYVAVGGYPSSKHPDIGTAAAYSTDGINYTLGATQFFSGGGGGFNDVVFGNGLFVAVGTDAVVQTSTDGTLWVSRYSKTFESLGGVAYGGGQFVAVGPSLIARSTNGITWTENFTPSANIYKGITYAQGQFVAVGYQGSLGTSTDGTVWTPRTSGSPTQLNSVVYGNGTYVAVGLGGTIIRSANGITWTNGVPFTALAINHITFGNGKFVTTGENGEIFTSPNGTNWTKRQTGTDGFNLNGMGYANGTFVAVGDGAYILTSPDDGVVPPSGDFAITGVTTVNCVEVTPTNRSLTFTPTYTGTNGQPISFSVANEMVTTTNPGPYTLSMYIDNPVITLKATQSGTPGEVSYSYNWLSVCNGVPPVNQPPVAPFIADASGMVGQVFSQSIPPFVDPEGQPLTYSVAGLSPGLLVIDGGNMVGPPTTAGVYPITVTATDPGGLSASATYTLTINPAGSDPGAFSITGVTAVNCVTVTATNRSLTFTPTYAGTNGQPISFSVANEMVTTTSSGPFTLSMYIDNPTILLKATQSGTAGEATYTYNWLAACNNAKVRLGFEKESELAVRVLGNPVSHTVSIEVSGAEGVALGVSLTDVAGRVVSQRHIQRAQQTDLFTFDVSAQPAGLLLLRVSTASQSRTLHLLKNQ